MRINISIDDKLLKDFDSYCEKYRFNRSEFVSRLMRDVIFGTPKTQGGQQAEIREVVDKDETSTIIKVTPIEINEEGIPQVR